MLFHLGVGRSEIEWKLKVKIQISILTLFQFTFESRPSPARAKNGGKLKKVSIPSAPLAVEVNLRFTDLCLCMRMAVRSSQGA